MSAHHGPGPMTDATTTTPDEWCRGDVHDWFELSYSSYLVLPRTLMQEMPPEWQHQMVALLERMRQEFPAAHDSYRVLKIDDGNRFVRDPLRNYRYPDDAVIDALRESA